MTPELENLLSAYIDGPDDPQLQEALSRHLDEHPEDREEVLRLVRDHAALELILGTREEALPEAVIAGIRYLETGEDFTRRVQRRLRLAHSKAPVRRVSGRKSRARRPKVPALRYGIISLGAAAALLLVVHYVSVRPVRRIGSELCAEVVEVRGEAALVEGGLRRRISPGDVIGPGREVQTGPAALVKLRYPSGSELYMNGSTVLSLVAREGPPGVSMERGRVYVETVPRDRGFRVETPHGRAVDLGTRFGIETEIGRGTTVVVAEGKVDASTQKGKVRVNAGNEVLLAGKTSPPGEVRRARELEKRLAWATGAKPAPVSPGAGRDKGLAYRVVDDFEGRSSVKWIAAGNIGSIVRRSVVSPGYGGGHAMRVDYDVKRATDPSSVAPFWGALGLWGGVLVEWKGRRPEDWSAHDGIEFRYFGNKTGARLRLGLFDNRRPGAPRNKDTWERFVSYFHDDVQGWKHVRIPWRDFTRSEEQPSGAPDDGLTLREVVSIAVLVFEGKGWFMIDDIRLFSEVPSAP